LTAIDLFFSYKQANYRRFYIYKSQIYRILGNANINLIENMNVSRYSM